VSYPCDSTSVDQSLCPPQGSSASFWNEDFLEDQAFNWYIDSTPIPGEANNDFSTISGMVLLDSMPEGADVFVTPHGRLAGTCFSEDYMEVNYSVQGLGPGWYQVEALVYSPNGTLHGFYPESVFVGYSQNLTGINIDLRAVGIAERAQPVPSARPELRVRGAELDVLCPTQADVRLAVFDQTVPAARCCTKGVWNPGSIDSSFHPGSRPGSISPNC
jgi:hypothetical protein